MSADKRSTHTDALATLGTIIEDGGRDAIHLAVEPVIAGEKLFPGQDIGLHGDDGKAYSNSRGDIVKFVGIVDPFLKKPVHEGQKFWLILYPRQITSLRHVWSHPDFDEEQKPTPEKKESVEDIFLTAQKWISDWANSLGLTYEKVISAADDNYGINLGQNEGEEVPEEFWLNYQIVRNKVVPVHERGFYFSCAC